VPAPNHHAFARMLGREESESRWPAPKAPPPSTPSLPPRCGAPLRPAEREDTAVGALNRAATVELLCLRPPARPASPAPSCAEDGEEGRAGCWGRTGGAAYVPRAAGHGCGGRGRRAEGETGQPPREQGWGRGRPRLGSCSPVGERASCSPRLDLAPSCRCTAGFHRSAAGEGRRSESRGRRDLAAAGSRPVRRERGDKKREERDRWGGERPVGPTTVGWYGVWDIEFDGCIKTGTELENIDD
jgi:hypothetical protein